MFYTPVFLRGPRTPWHLFLPGREDMGGYLGRGLTVGAPGAKMTEEVNVETALSLSQPRENQQRWRPGHRHRDFIFSREREWVSRCTFNSGSEANLKMLFQWWWGKPSIDVPRCRFVAQPAGRWADTTVPWWVVKLVEMVVMVKMFKPNEWLFSCSIQRSYSKQNERTEVVLLCISCSSAKYTWQKGWQVYKNKYILDEKNKTTPKVVTRRFISYYVLNDYYINIQHRHLEKNIVY